MPTSQVGKLRREKVQPLESLYLLGTITYRRRLPHVHVIGKPLFVTFRLFDSLPQHRTFPTRELIGGKAFVAMDRLLDAGRFGPLFLRNPEIAAEVLSALHRGVELGHYDLHAWVIMPNDVHLFFTPRTELPTLLGSLMCASAKRANLILSRTGESFWQDESFDRLIRNEAEFVRVRRYIEANPVKAGLSDAPEQYRWSSAWQG